MADKRDEHTPEDAPPGGSGVVVDPSLKQATVSSPEQPPAPAPRPATESDADAGWTPPPDPPPGPRPRQPRRLWGLPIWGWLLVLVGTVVLVFLVMDLRNRDRYLMVCKEDTLELHRGRRIPWPFGHEVMGGPAFKPVKMRAQSDCRDRVFDSRDEAERAFLEFLVSQVRVALDHPGEANLAEARKQVLQALVLTRTHRSRRKTVQRLLAEVAYREGRAGLARVEDQLRTALSRFREAQKLDASRFEDLDDWIAHLEQLLRQVSPSPSQPLPLTSSPVPLPGMPGSQPAAGWKSSADAGAPSPPAPDAGAPAAGSGILL
jgi:hypothetical protein